MESRNIMGIIAARHAPTGTADCVTMAMNTAMNAHVPNNCAR